MKLHLQSSLAKLTSPKTNFTRNQIGNSKQAEAAQKTEKLVGLVQDVGLTMSQIDETAGDLNKGRPGDIMGKSPYKAHTSLEGRVQLNGESVKDMNVTISGHSGQRLEVRTDKSGKQHIEHTKVIRGKAGEDSLVQKQWAVLDGEKVSYKEAEFFSGGWILNS